MKDFSATEFVNYKIPSPESYKPLPIHTSDRIRAARSPGSRSRGGISGTV